MTERSHPSDPLSDPVVAAAIEAKDRIIRRQAERIDELETEIRRLHEDRQRLGATIKSLLHNEQQKQRLTTSRVVPQGNPIGHVGMNSFVIERSGNGLVSGTTSSVLPQFGAGPSRSPQSDIARARRNFADVESCSLAARTIQLAYRRYLMNKNFARLRTDVERSKRLIRQTQQHPENCDLAKDTSTENDYVEIGVTGHPKTTGLGTINEHSSESARAEDGAPPCSVCAELSDSSDSESALEMSLEPSFDESSTNFEHLLEAEEVEGADDSFNSEGSQEGEAFSSRCSTLRAGNLAGLHQQCPSLMSSFESSNSSNQAATLPTHLSDVTFSDSESLSGDISAIQLEDASSFESSSFDSGSHASGDSLKFYLMDGSYDTFFQFCTPSFSPIWKRKTTSGSTGSLQDTSSAQVSCAGSLDMSGSFDSSQNGDGPSTGRCPRPDNAGAGLRHVHTSPGAVPKYLSPVHTSHPGIFHGIPHDIRCHHVLQQVNSCDREVLAQSDRLRKRVYRIGLNLFNRKPEKGIKYLIENKFIDLWPYAVARFLVSRKGLSRQMIGEYLGNIQKPFNVDVLRCFAEEIDLTGLQVDVALRKYQSFFRMPGEAQKIERLMEVFARRYCACNSNLVNNFRTPDTVFLLAFAIIMLNTDQHNKCIKDERRMKLKDFINNLRGIDDGHDVDPDLLAGIFERVRSCEFKPASDHVSQVARVEQMITGKKLSLQLVAQHRRLVCYCRLFEVPDLTKPEKIGSHQRELFLFNDLLVVTKMLSKKRKSITYSFRQAFSLHRVAVYLFETPYYKYGVRLATADRGKELITLCARNENDRIKFVDDLKETILELEEMEVLDSYESKKEQNNRSNVSRSHLSRQGSREVNRHSKDSGVADIDRLSHHRLSASDCEERKNSVSSSVFDFSERHRTESRSSLDSGLASTGSSSANSCVEPVKLRAHSATIASSCAREAAFRKNKLSN